MRRVWARAVARTEVSGIRGMLFRQFLAIGLVALAIWAMRDRFTNLDLHQISNAVGAVSGYQWGLALAATAVSFWAIGRYDDIIHGLLGTGIGREGARQSGVAAVAVAQFAGFGVLTGALVRWKMLPDLPLLGALRVSAAVSGSFLAGWAVLTAAVFLLAGGTTAMPVPLATGIAYAGLMALTLPVLLSRWPGHLPSVLAMARILAVVAIDLGFAAAAFYVLLPPEMSVPAGAYLTALLIAITAGLISGTPGGIGAFELALLTQLPNLPAEPLIAAALAFRLVYHVFPALLAVPLLLRGASADGGVPQVRMPDEPGYNPRLTKALWEAPWAEAKLILQGDFGLIGPDSRPMALACETGQSMVMLGGPLVSDATPAEALATLAEAAGRKSRSPLVYKAPPDLAAAARRDGWQVLAISREAWLDPASYTTDGPRLRQLRRSLSKAEREGVTITEGGRDLPIDQMAAIAAIWARRQGGERGFSMGRFDPAYVADQRVFLAWSGDKLAGFITLHETRNEWTLDLMRQADDAPSGAMHLAVHCAILAARDARAPRLSLAAAQYDNPDLPRSLRALSQRAQEASGAEGLIRFKSSFAPNWRRLYALSPSRAGLMIGLADVARRIHR